MVWIAANPFVVNLLRNYGSGTSTVPTTESTTITTTATTVTTTTATTTTTTTTMTTTTTTTSTTTRSFVNYTNITRPNDTIVGIYYTIAGSFSAATVGNFPASESPANAIDMNIGTKYLNFGFSGSSSTTAGLNTGYYVSPRIGSSIATGIIFYTANDSPNRDPTMITLEGSNNGSAQLQCEGRWTLIYSGPSGISPTVDPGRSTMGILITFNNTIPYMSYRLLITAKRNADSCVQYGEARIMGYV